MASLSLDVPNFEVESSDECMKLATLWDVRGLLCLMPDPIAPGLFSRVFNAFKDRDRDRQIGDRRLPNLSEHHVDGPSKQLPQGPQLTSVRVPRFTHLLRGSVTDRRDFYHQAAVTLERAQSNMLPFAYPTEAFVGTQAYAGLLERSNLKPPRAREIAGDQLDCRSAPKQPKRHSLVPERVHPCFSSLFQGDHLGVEFALRSHSLLLENHGLLRSEHRILGGCPVPIGRCWDALVIDDYFAFGIEPVSSPPEKSFAMHSLAVARGVYQKEGLMGSDEKDVVAQPVFKAAGAEVRSSEKNARSGVIPVGAPFSKRIALSVLSLRSAVLPGTSARLVSRLAGNWVSVLQYRKCFSSLIDGLFKLSSKSLEEPMQCVHKLPRSIAQEITMLAVMAPLIFSNVSVDFLDHAYATDASVQKGAIVSTSMPEEVHEVLWQSADKRGAYTHLDNGFRGLLRQIGDVDDDQDFPGPLPLVEPLSKQPLLYFDFVEICGGAGKVSKAVSSFGRSVAPVLDLSNSRHYNLSCLRLTEWIIYMIEENRFRSFLIAPPCTSFSPAAHPAVRSYRQPLGFDRQNPKTWLGNQLAFRTLLLLRVGRRCFRPCAAEQSRLSKMCWLDLWKALLSLGFDEAVIASCVFGSIHRKEFRFFVFLLDAVFLTRRCPGGHAHVKVEGSYTKASAIYVDGLAWHVGEAFHRALKAIEAKELLVPDVQGQETVLANDVMASSRWHTVRAWFWKRCSHINVLELAAAVSVLGSVAQSRSSVRFASFLDSSVCRGALAKGRSASYALQPGLKRACAWCVAFDLYPAWPFSPTRLNVADDPSRGTEPRQPVALSLVRQDGLMLSASVASGLRRFTANWCRLCLLVLLTQPAPALGSSVYHFGFQSEWPAKLLSVCAWVVVTVFCSLLLSCGLSFVVP